MIRRQLFERQEEWEEEQKYALSVQKKRWRLGSVVDVNPLQENLS